jgi:predicted RNase H-like HicB family nuclease
MRYAVVIKKSTSGYSAYVPDLPGCVATGDSVATVEREIGDAIRTHVDNMRRCGQSTPRPTSLAAYVEA